MDRYSRQIMVDGIGEDGQRRLSDATVAIVGCGALGSMVGMQLAGMGVRRIRIADFDTVSISNLHRQLAFSESDEGEAKSKVLANRMRSINSDIDVIAFDMVVTRENAPDLFTGCDFVIEGSDNLATKYLIDSVCTQMRIPYCIGGVNGFKGQVITCLPGTKRYIDLFPIDESDISELTSVPLGVIGPTPATVASIQSTECLKYLTGNTEGLLTNRLLTIDLLTMRFLTISLSDLGSES